MSKNQIKSKVYMKHLFFVTTVAVALWLLSCASPAPLGGGPKDDEAPAFLGANPPQYSRNVHKNKATLLFNEFLSLQKINQQLIVSPTIEPKPTIVLRGKKLLIKQDKAAKLLPNTTYTFSFGSAICDLHENTPLKDFQYVFSTGANLDTLSIRGSIADAQNMSPKAEVLVGLYRSATTDTLCLDSLPLTQPPLYLARTNDEGAFQLNNLAAGSYLLFALEDKNANRFYDLPGEAIAFADSMLSPQPVYNYIPDSIAIDTANTVLMDSLWAHHSYTTVLSPQPMFMFSEVQTKPQLLESALHGKQKITLIYKNPLADSLTIEVLNDSSLANWYRAEYSTNKDTLSLWLQVPLPDTLRLQLSMDSVYVDTVQLVDSKAVAPSAKPKKRGRRRAAKPKVKVKKRLEYKVLSSSKHLFAAPLSLVFSTPLNYANLNSIKVLKDSVPLEDVNAYFTDSIHRHLRISSPWEQGGAYQLIIPEGSMRDMFETDNDSIVFAFTTTKKDDYGRLEMQMKLPPKAKANYIVQLEQGKGNKAKLMRACEIQGDTTLLMDNIVPGDYYVKAIEDSNGNHKWDAGSYQSRRQAEKVYYFPKAIKVKAMWTNKETWELSAANRKAVP